MNELNVLAVMDAAELGLLGTRPDSTVADALAVREARAAVAELVEADKEYDAAKSKYGSENHWESDKEAAKARLALSHAAARRSAALAKFGES
jgi:hypothetical protein